MTRPTEIRIDRLVLPASERNRAEAFRAALTQSLGAELGQGAASKSGIAAADKAAQAIAAKVRGAGG